MIRDEEDVLTSNHLLSDREDSRIYREDRRSLAPSPESRPYIHYDEPRGKAINPDLVEYRERDHVASHVLRSREASYNDMDRSPRLSNQGSRYKEDDRYSRQHKYDYRDLPPAARAPVYFRPRYEDEDARSVLVPSDEYFEFLRFKKQQALDRDAREAQRRYQDDENRRLDARSVASGPRAASEVRCIRDQENDLDPKRYTQYVQRIITRRELDPVRPQDFHPASQRQRHEEGSPIKPTGPFSPSYGFRPAHPDSEPLPPKEELVSDDGSRHRIYPAPAPTAKPVNAEVGWTDYQGSPQQHRHQRSGSAAPTVKSSTLSLKSESQSRGGQGDRTIKQVTDSTQSLLINTGADFAPDPLLTPPLEDDDKVPISGLPRSPVQDKCPVQPSDSEDKGRWTQSPISGQRDRPPHMNQVEQAPETDAAPKKAPYIPWEGGVVYTAPELNEENPISNEELLQSLACMKTEREGRDATKSGFGGFSEPDRTPRDSGYAERRGRPPAEEGGDSWPRDGGKGGWNADGSTGDGWAGPTGGFSARGGGGGGLGGDSGHENVPMAATTDASTVERWAISQVNARNPRESVAPVTDVATPGIRYDPARKAANLEVEVGSVTIVAEKVTFFCDQPREPHEDSGRGGRRNDGGGGGGGWSARQDNTGKGGWNDTATPTPATDDGWGAGSTTEGNDDGDNGNQNNPMASPTPAERAPIRPAPAIHPDRLRQMDRSARPSGDYPRSFDQDRPPADSIRRDSGWGQHSGVKSSRAEPPQRSSVPELAAPTPVAAKDTDNDEFGGW
ncbi:hypothetical protein CI109_103651 [Kwoniella shandongensis]|uniref:Uncharacterized protein n=1 Tax=Kwoniella shandongensis TaxID=1734106 RepID=A0A5M6C7W6_9TREE|nr:uncharacterized protein CI109_000655 [Kwoniella shandongensis]KAA5531083.1 hypothetical protein CI109_000655 [Kwoniella shandongensis]